MTESEARAGVVAAMLKLEASGLNRGRTGNASARWNVDGRSGMLITPTGMGADETTPEDLIWVADEGESVGSWQPSSEWHFHRATYRARPDVGAVLHTHAVHATALGCLGKALPAFHYMVAVAGGDDVPLVPYQTFGSEALADGVAAALAERDACLLAQHGLVSCGRDIDHALRVMIEIESLCQIYLLALSSGEPGRLDSAEMHRVLERFSHYGRKHRAE